MTSDLLIVLVIFQVVGSLLGMLGSYLNKNVKVEYKINGFIAWLISNVVLLIWSFSVEAYWISLMYLFFLYTAIDGLGSHIKLKSIDYKFDPPV